MSMWPFKKKRKVTEPVVDDTRVQQEAIQDANDRLAALDEVFRIIKGGRPTANEDGDD